MTIILSVRNSLWTRILSFVVIIQFLCLDLSWAGVNKEYLAARSRIQLFFSKNNIELSTPQEIALSIAMGQLQKSILLEGKTDISQEIQQANGSLSKVGITIITNILLTDEKSKIPYITIKINDTQNNFRVYFLKEGQRKVNERLMIEEKDLRHFDYPGLEGVWFVDEKKINNANPPQDIYREVYTILGSETLSEKPKMPPEGTMSRIGKLIIKDPSLFKFLADSVYYLIPIEIWNNLANIPEKYQFIIATYTPDGEIELEWREYTYQFFTDFWREMSRIEGMDEKFRKYFQFFDNWGRTMVRFLRDNPEQIMGFALDSIEKGHDTQFSEMYKGFLDTLAHSFFKHMATYYDRHDRQVEPLPKDPWKYFLTILDDLRDYTATKTMDVFEKNPDGGFPITVKTPLREMTAFRFHSNIRQGRIIQGTEAKKELDANRSTGRYKPLRDIHSTLWEEVQRVATETGVSLDGITVYGITSIVKGKKDFVHGYFDRVSNELFLSINIMQQAETYDRKHGTRLFDEYIEHELKCRGENHQELRIQQRQKYHRHGNYKDTTEDEGRLRDIIREDTDMRAAVNEFIEMIKAIGRSMQEQKQILESDPNKIIIRFNLGQKETVVSISEETMQEMEKAYHHFREGLNLSPGSDYIAGSETHPDNIRRRNENYDEAIYLFGKLIEIPSLANLAKEMQKRARKNKELAIRQTAMVSPHDTRDAEIIRLSHMFGAPLPPDVGDSRIPAVEYIVAPREVILAFNTEIGNINNNQELLEQIRDVADMWGGITFITWPGEDVLERQIKDKIDQLQSNGTARKDIKVIVVTNTNRGQTKFGLFSGYSLALIDDNAVADYIPLPELLSFVLTLHLESKSPERDERLKTLYQAITGREITDEYIQKIKWAEIPITLPRVEKISVEIYKGALEVLTAA